VNLTGLSVRNPVAVKLLMLAVIAGGVYTALTATREFFPAFETNLITVTVPYPGATPDEIEKSVTLPIERGLQDLRDVKEIRSTVSEGFSTTIVELETDASDPDKILNDVRGHFDRVKPDLPEGVEDPSVAMVEPLLPVIAVVLFGDVTEYQLRDSAIDVRNDLQTIPGIARIAVSGIRKREIWVEVQPSALEANGLTFAEVGQAIASSNLDLPGGQVKSSNGNIRIRTKAETDRADELEQLQVRSRLDGATTRLGEIANVKEAFEDRVTSGRFQGQRAVQLVVFKGEEEDALDIAQAIRAYVSEHPTIRGGAISLDTTLNLSRFIQQRLELLSRNALWGLLLVGITLAIFLDLRVAFWVAAGLPISLCGTLIVMSFWGISVNLMSMFGMIVVMGLIVDDAIVIGENIFTKIREGRPAMEAAIEGTREVSLPVVAAVLTTIVAFAPLAFLEGAMGTIFRQLPMVMIAALAISLVEAFVILPSHLSHGKRSTRPPSPMVRAKHRMLEENLPAFYEPILRFVLRWRYPALAATFLYGAVVIGMVQGGIIPYVFIQEEDAETIMVTLEMAAGTTERRTTEVIEAIEAIIVEEPEVASAYAVVGAAFDDRGQSNSADPSTLGQLTVELLPGETRERDGLRSSNELLAQFRRQTAAIPGIDKLAFLAQSGGAGGPELEIRVSGEEFSVLRDAVQYVRDEVGQFEGVFQIEDNLKIGKLEVQLELLDTAPALGLTTRDLALLIRSALYGFEAQKLQDERGEIKVRVVLPEASRISLAHLERLRVPTPTGGRVPLMEVASLNTKRGFGTLARVNGKRAISITADVDEATANAYDVVEKLRERLADIGERFPGTSISFEGQQRDQTDAFGSLVIGFPAALLGIYAIIAILFRSYLQPLIVMAAIPYSLVGALLGHYIVGYPFTLLSMIGSVALAGIVVNDSLLLVDFVNRARLRGMPLVEAVVHGGKARLRAIVLTSLTTISGLAPMMLEQSFQAQFLIPMAVSIIFGLGFATGMTLLLLPVLYLVLDDLKQLVAAAGVERQAQASIEPPGQPTPRIS
jgi:HAE1 family hydrophobic/amphiphilic exporter-1